MTTTPRSTRIPISPPSLHTDAWLARVEETAHVDPMEALGLAPGDTVLVVGAHPDDETLGSGATVAELASRGVDVRLLSLTAGTASFVGFPVDITPAALGDLRTVELGRAGERLGAAGTTVAGLPDGALADHETEAVDAIAAEIDRHAAVRLLSVWRHDPHPDHQAAGRATTLAARDAGLEHREFAVWAPHWTDPATVTATLTRLRCGDPAWEAKQAAIGEYRSQTQRANDDVGPVVPAELVAWPHEIWLSPDD